MTRKASTPQAPLVFRDFRKRAAFFALPVVDKSLEALTQTELVSFREAIRTGAEAIMKKLFEQNDIPLEFNHVSKTVRAMRALGKMA